MTRDVCMDTSESKEGGKAIRTSYQGFHFPGNEMILIKFTEAELRTSLLQKDVRMVKVSGGRKRESKKNESGTTV